MDGTSPPLQPALRRPLTGFVGREHDLGTLATLVISPTVRLLTIMGPGGIGKTRTALELIATATVREAFPDGVVFVPLAPTNDPSLVPAAIAQAFRLEPRTDTTAIDALQGVMARRQILLVLDNCEHLPAAALFFAELLQAHVDLTILATSRTRLDLTGEQVFALDPLSPVDARSLFMNRAGAANLHHARNDSETTIDAICTRLDRMPLAIELAAARTATLPPDALLERLAKPLPFLRNGPRDLPLRHQTMRDTIAWSYDLLDEQQRTGFRRLAVFMGGFTLESAQVVLGETIDALELIEFLVDSSLIVLMQAESGIPRFTMLESIRQFGIEQLVEAGDEAQVRAAHADALINLVERVIPDYDGPNLYVTLSTVTDEMNNIRAALTWTLDQRDGARANRLAGSIWRVWARGEARWLSGHSWRDLWAEGSVWTERALALRDGVPFAALVESLIGIGQLLTTLGEAERAAPYAEELLSRAEQEDPSDHYAAYWAHLTLAEIARQRDNRQKALHHAQAALATAPLVRDPQNQIAGAEIILGQLQLTWGNPAAAETHLLAAITAGQASQNSRHIAVAAFLISIVDVLLDQPEQAVHHALLVFRHLEILHDHAHYQGPTLSVARVALRYGLPRIAVQLCAYAATLPHQYTSVEIDESVLAPFRAALAQPAYTDEWTKGTRLTYPEVRAIAERLANAPDREAIGSETETSTSTSTLLSPREVEVVRLLVAGGTNREIANTLSISVRTAEKHVLNIMGKLDVDTRTGIVAWAVRQGIA